MYVLSNLSVKAPSERNKFAYKFAARSVPARFSHFKFAADKEVHNFGWGALCSP
jgi:hypothetical protein